MFGRKSAVVVRVRVSAFIHCFDYWKKRKIWLKPLNWLTYVGFSSTRAEAFLLSGLNVFWIFGR